MNINQVEGAGFDAIEVANSAQIPYDYICGLNQKLADRAWVYQLLGGVIPISQRPLGDHIP